jgi:hypothetical protein
MIYPLLIIVNPLGNTPVVNAATAVLSDQIYTPALIVITAGNSPVQPFAAAQVAKFNSCWLVEMVP